MPTPTFKEAIFQAQHDRFAQLSLLATAMGYLEAGNAPRKAIRLLEKEAKRLKALNYAYCWAWGCAPAFVSAGEQLDSCHSL